MVSGDHRGVLARRLGVVLAALALAAPALAGADDVSVSDPADPDEMMDPVLAQAAHARHGVLVHTITADRPFADGDLYRLVLVLHATRHGRRTSARRVVVTPPSGPPPWRAPVRDSHGRAVGSAAVSRPTDRSIAIELRRRLLGRRARGYLWFAVATTACRPAEPGALCGGPKRDRVPDTGMVRHRLREPQRRLRNARTCCASTGSYGTSG